MHRHLSAKDGLGRGAQADLAGTGCVGGHGVLAGRVV